jgi:hypothetical protein
MATWIKCENCSDDFTIVLKHKIYVRFYDKTKGKTGKTSHKHRYISIGLLCPKCLNMEIDNLTPQLFNKKAKKKTHE